MKIPTIDTVIAANKKQSHLANIKYIEVEAPHLDINQHILDVFDADQIVDVSDNHDWKLLKDNELHSPATSTVRQLTLLANIITLIQEHRLTILKDGTSPKTARLLWAIDDALDEFSSTV